MANIVIFDMAALRFRPNASRTAMALLAPSGEHLALVGILPDTSNEDAVFAVLDHALVAGRVRRDGQVLRIGLYHPLTGQVSVDAGPTKVFESRTTVALSPHGEVGEISGDSDDEQLTVAGVVLEASRSGFAAATRAWGASRVD